ncbi:MAG TPA: hypothetical protein GXX55_00810 [Firmicutes bacterium]|nr:hypothetical protein [Bacillota bacterium]
MRVENANTSGNARAGTADRGAEPAVTISPPPGLRKERRIKPDGRYIVFYSAEDEQTESTTRPTSGVEPVRMNQGAQAAEVVTSPAVNIPKPTDEKGPHRV